MHIGTKVGEFSISQRKKLSPTLEIEQIFEGDIYRETLAQDIDAGFKNFSEKYGIKTDKKQKTQTKSPSTEIDQVLSNFKN